MMSLSRLITLTAALACAGALRSQPPRGLGGGPPGMPGLMEPRERLAFLLDVLASELGLNKSQRAEVQRLIHTARQSARPQQEQLLSTRRAIREAVKTGSPRSVLDGLHRELGALHVQLADIETRTFADIWLLLRREQRIDADIAYNMLGAMMLDLPGGPAPPFGGRMPPPPKQPGTRSRTP